MQRRPTLNWVCHFIYTSLYTYIKIHSNWEICFAQRNALQVAIVCFEYTVFTVRKKKLVRSSPLKIILFGFIVKRELFSLCVRSHLRLNKFCVKPFFYSKLRIDIQFRLKGSFNPQ